MNNADRPEVLAIMPVPLQEGRQTALARLLLLTIDMTLAGEALGLETVRDLVREVRHCYPRECQFNHDVAPPPRPSARNRWKSVAAGSLASWRIISAT